MKLIDWNEISNMSLHGWHLEGLIERWAKEEADKACEQCGIGGDCIHNGARTLLGIIRFIKRPDNCPECKRLREEHGEQT